MFGPKHASVVPRLIWTKYVRKISGYNFDLNSKLFLTFKMCYNSHEAIEFSLKTEKGGTAKSTLI